MSLEVSLPSKDLVPAFIQKGSEITGGATGAALGFLAAGPLGAALGGAAGTIVTQTGGVVADFVERTLSHRETVRAAGSVSLSLGKIKERLDEGCEPRDDDFFRIRTGYRPKAEDLFEAMMIKSKNQYEEHKVYFYANLFANACFDENLSADIVSWFMLVLDKLTFSHIETLNEFVVLGSNSKWEWGHLDIIAEHSHVVAAQLEELKGMRLLSLDHWGDTPIEATPISVQFINAIGFSNPFDSQYDHVIRTKNGAAKI
ncbi:hypothetical protein [Aeromonas schubertii]|uniref:hypothetical protein n=1 Tax=Aeromonas schubertii TaxID=652 RepID=UPI000B22E136|nr:hypothetical protein [Aeromonas schubertii]